MRSPSREHTGNIDDLFVLSSIALMMHQFYIEYCKQWWLFDVTSMFHLCSQCFSTMKPTMFIFQTARTHRWNIDESSIKQYWITNEKNVATVRCFTAEFKAIEFRALHIKSSFPITLNENICQKFRLKSKRTIIRTLTEKNLTAILIIDFRWYRIHFWAKQIYNSFFWTLTRKTMDRVLKT